MNPGQLQSPERLARVSGGFPESVRMRWNKDAAFLLFSPDRRCPLYIKAAELDEGGQSYSFRDLQTVEFNRIGKTKLVKNQPVPPEVKFPLMRKNRVDLCCAVDAFRCTAGGNNSEYYVYTYTSPDYITSH